MFCNVLIRVDDNEVFNTDCFYYNDKEHYLRFHLPYQTKGSVWSTITSVKCIIEIGRPMIYVTVKTIKEYYV